MVEADSNSFGNATLPQGSPLSTPRRAESSTLDRRPTASNIELPRYVRDGVAEYMLAHKGTTFRTVVMTGLRQLGIEIDNDDLVAERAMRTPRRRAMSDEDTPNTLRPTSTRLPRYVRVRAEEYLLAHPDMRFRHLVMAGFRKLGISVAKADLVAERQNVLAEIPIGGSRRIS